MKKSGFILFLILSGFSGSAQLFARVILKEKITGLCDEKNVYRLFANQKDEKVATPSILKSDIQDRLDKNISFLKDSTLYNARVWVTLFINCNGEMVDCKIKTNKKSSELDLQIINIFTNLGVWHPGQLRGKNVDTSCLWAMEIINGKIEIK